MTEITATKRKLIMKDMASYPNGVVANAQVNHLALKYQLTAEPVRKLIAAMGYTVEPPPEKPRLGEIVQAQVEKVRKERAEAPALPAEVIATILSGKLYKVLDPDPDLDPSETFVVIRKDVFLREREAIRKLLKG